MFRIRTLTAIAAVFVAAAAPASAQAAPEPEDVIREVVAAADQVIDRVAGQHPGAGEFPPAGFAVTAVTWSKTATQLTPVFTPPDPTTSHPANWSCTTSTTTTTASAVCTPTDPPDPGTSGWACYDPYVVADITSALGAAGPSIYGASHCGTSYAGCTATATLAGAGHCSNWAFPHQPVPLKCDADFSKATKTSAWTVRCAPIDP